MCRSLAGSCAWRCCTCLPLCKMRMPLEPLPDADGTCRTLQPQAFVENIALYDGDVEYSVRGGARNGLHWCPWVGAMSALRVNAGS